MKLKRVWPVVFSLVMLLFAGFMAWQIYASASVKSGIDEAEQDLKRQKGMLKQQQVEAEKALSEIQYYRNMLDDMQPEYDVIVSKKAQKKALGDQLKLLQNAGDDEEDEYEYEEVDDEDEEDFYDTDF